MEETWLLDATSGEWLSRQFLPLQPELASLAGTVRGQGADGAVERTERRVTSWRGQDNGRIG